MNKVTLEFRINGIQFRDPDAVAHVADVLAQRVADNKGPLIIQFDPATHDSKGIRFVHEPENTADMYATSIHVFQKQTGEWAKIGYVSRWKSEEFQTALLHGYIESVSLELAQPVSDKVKFGIKVAVVFQPHA